jgi:hypothetical protein
LTDDAATDLEKSANLVKLRAREAELKELIAKALLEQDTLRNQIFSSGGSEGQVTIMTRRGARQRVSVLVFLALFSRLCNDVGSGT